MATSEDDQLRILKPKRTKERSNVTRFVASINALEDSSPVDDYEYYHERLRETLDKLIVLDDTIQDRLSDEEFDADVTKCEEYVDSAKRALQRASKKTDQRLVTSTSSLSINQPVTPPGSTIITPSVKLPTIKLEPFSGDIETWSRFWEQFQSSVDQNPTVSVIDKHVFLRGYLEGEARRLVDGIAVTADTYSETKRILQSKYGDKNRIIQSHLDFLENLKPIRCDTVNNLNDMIIECQRRLQALKAGGEDSDSDGRILAPKIMRAFSEDICRR